MAKKLPSQALFLKVCRQGLTSPTFGEQKAGQCKRWVRQMQTAAGVPVHQRCPTGIDAKQCARWYRENAPECVVTGGGLPGDIYFWEHGHGKHGHVFVRDFGNVFIGNSVAFAPLNQVDGRGTVAMRFYEPPSLIVRTWKR